MGEDMTTPDALMVEAKRQMLEGREPASFSDWALIMNFCAFAIKESTALLACKLLARIYKMPLSDAQVEGIVQFQQARKSRMKRA